MPHRPAGLPDIVASAATVWSRRPPASASQFAETHIRLADDVEASGGRYDLADNPFWREIIDATHDPFVESVAVQKSTQVGGTLANIVAALATCQVDPAPSMFVVPTRDDGRLLRDRIYANALASDSVLADRVPPVRLRNMISVDLETMHVYLAWPKSKQRMRGKPCKYVWLSEIDVYEFDTDAGDPNTAAERRTDRFPESTIVRESTPVGDDSPIARYFDAGDMRRWHVPCPHCGTWQSLRFFSPKSGRYAGKGGIAGYRDDDGNHVDAETARRQAHYVCTAGCRIDQPHKAAMIRAGRWVPDGQKIDKRGRLRGQPLRPPRRRSYHLWQIMNPAKTFGDIAAAYLAAVDGGSLREFTQDVLGLRFRSSRRMPAWHTLGRRLAWSNPRGTVPPQAWFLAAGADVQDDRVLYSVRGYAPGWTSWLVDWGELVRAPTPDGDPIGLLSDLLQIDDLLARSYPVQGDRENPLGRRSLPIRLIGLDSNYRTGDVHEFCLGHPAIAGGRLRAIRGDHHVTPRERYRMTTVARDPATGERIEDADRQLEVWGIQVDFYKQKLVERIAATPRTGWPEETDPKPVPGGFYVTSDTLQLGEKYLKQLVNEPPTVVVDPSTGRRRLTFRPRSTNIGVDFWDTTVYADAIADMIVGSLGWSAAAWKKSLQPARSRTRSRGKKSQLLNR